MTTFTRKILSAEITLGKGEFGATAGESVMLTGLRMAADMVNPLGDSMGDLSLRIYGLSQDRMNKLTSIGTENVAFRAGNKIKLKAGDESGMSLIFEGLIFTAWADYSGAPEVPFYVMGVAGMDALITPADPTSIKGGVAVSEIMAGLAKTMGLIFEDGGVKVRLSNPYFPGTALQQVRLCAQAADIWFAVENGKLAIWPKNASRPGTIPLISVGTGMVGYPTMNAKSLSVRTLFDPRIRLGGDVKIESSLPMATGTFNVIKITHSLSCEVAGGPWFTNLECIKNVAT